MRTPCQVSTHAPECKEQGPPFTGVEENRGATCGQCSHPKHVCSRCAQSETQPVRNIIYNNNNNNINNTRTSGNVFFPSTIWLKAEHPGDMTIGISVSNLARVQLLQRLRDRHCQGHVPGSWARLAPQVLLVPALPAESPKIIWAWVFSISYFIRDCEELLHFGGSFPSCPMRKLSSSTGVWFQRENKGWLFCNQNKRAVLHISRY